MKREFPTAWCHLAAVRVFAVLSVLMCGTGGWAQQPHPHTPNVSGMPQGVPLFCVDPTATSTGSGAWSDPRTWSTRRVPGPNERIAIAAGHKVIYNTVSEAKLDCIEVRGHLAFATAQNTFMKVGTLLVLEDGHLEIGSPAKPVAPDATAQLVIADQPINTEIDPGQVGTGLIGLGKVTMHGVVTTPTFVRLRREPLVGHRTIELEQQPEGWRPGDAVVIPDTRQLRTRELGNSYESQTEKVQISSISGSEVTLTAPLKYSHRGARNADGGLEFLPHVGNLARNVIVRSENPSGTRGHTMFISHADVDLRYVEFRELGRTKNGALDSTQFNTEDSALKIGTNQIGRYAIHFHHNFGRKKTPANGYQFTLVGNAVDGAPKWGITIHRSHYGLIQDNVVYNTRGAGIATEDGSESFNVFAHNFAVRVAGGEAAGSRGYGGSTPDVGGGEGSGFWFRGPNNYIRNNVAASAARHGFAVSAASLGMVRVPAFKGTDTSRSAESVQVDTTNASVMEFANNETYGAVQIGLECVWNGTIANFTVWHPSQHGFMGLPPEQLSLDALTVRGDPSVLSDPSEKPVGVSIANYISRRVSVTNANVQGMRVGILSPFFYKQTPERGRGPGSIVIEAGYFRNHIGISVATAYTSKVDSGMPVKNAVVRSSVFEPLKGQFAGPWPSESISMNYDMIPRDSRPRDPILVYDYNKQPGNNFKVYYSYQAPEATAPCHNAVGGIGGWVCKSDLSK